MATIKFSNRHLTFQKAKYFTYAASSVKLGHLGLKNDHRGQFEPKRLVKEVKDLAEASGPVSVVDFLAIRKSGGKGRLEFSEPTEALKVAVKVSGSKTKLVVGRIAVYSIESGIIKDYLQKEEYRSQIEGKQMAVADGVVAVKEFMEFSAKEFKAELDAGLSVADIIKASIGADGGTSVATTMRLSEGTVLGYRLQHVWINSRGGVSLKRDSPGRAETKPKK
jgi:hypothetical protein